MITDEGQMNAALIMRDSANEARRAADKMEDAARQIAVLLEDGYGGNGLLLLEALWNIKRPAGPLCRECGETVGSHHMGGIEHAFVPELPLAQIVSELLDELLFWFGKKHEGDCSYTDKSDEGCYLCEKAQRERYSKTQEVILKAGPRARVTYEVWE